MNLLMSGSEDCPCEICRRDGKYKRIWLKHPSKTATREMGKLLGQRIVAAADGLNLIWTAVDSRFMRKWEELCEDCCSRHLQSAFPGLSKEHRPDFDLLRRGKIALHAASKEEIAWRMLWPHINIADLSKPELLYLFRNERAMKPPSDFAFRDLANANIATRGHSGHYALAYDCAMKLYRVSEEQQYGALTKRNSFQRNEHQMSPEVGIAVLKFQEPIYIGAERLVKNIIDG